MADSTIPLNSGTGGKTLDTENVTVGGNSVERARNQIAGAGAAEIARVMNAQPAGTEYGLAVREVPGDNVTGSTALGAANATIAVACAGMQGAGFQLLAGTLVGTIVPEVSLDGGTTWIPTFFDDSSTSAKASSIVFGSANAATARSILLASGASHARVRVSAYTSGTANASARASMAYAPSVSQQRSSTTTQSNVAATLSASTTLLAANANRLNAVIFNDSTTGTLYVSENNTATTTQHTFQVLPGQGWQVTSGYVGIVTGVWSVASGSARATEYVA